MNKSISRLKTTATMRIHDAKEFFLSAGAGIVFCLLFVTLDCPSLYGQESYRTRMSLDVTQLDANEIELEARLRARIEGRYSGIPNNMIRIFSVSDTSEFLLGEGSSDNDGFVRISVKSEALLKQADGYYNVVALFEGDDTYDSSDDDVAFKAASLQIIPETVDSINLIKVKLDDLSSETNVGIEDAEVFLRVPRLFSDLTLASGYTDEDGMAEFQFPNDLPGGTNGELVIKVEIPDTDDFGAIVRSTNLDWGVPVQRVETEERALWTPNAPLWMVITFAVLMTLVWGHYIVIIIKLYKMKNLGPVAES